MRPAADRGRRPGDACRAWTEDRRIRGVASPRRRRREGGQALVTALFVLLLVGIAMAVAVAAVQLEMRTVRHEARSVRLRAMADAAVAATLAELAADRGSQGLDERSFDGGTIESRVRERGPLVYEITARARHAGLTRTVQVTADFGRAPPLVGGWRRVPGG